MSELYQGPITIPLERLREFETAPGGAPSPSDREGNEVSFRETFQKTLSEVDGLQKDADRALQNFAAGDGTDIHTVMIAAEKAAISFHLLLAMRNKLLEAYQEVMRMQV
jgi:flagellar hook-basal body complex protein FliE